MNNLYVDRLLRAGFVFIVIVSVFFVILSLNALKQNKYIGGDVYPQSTISVMGRGEVFAVPDVAQFSFSVVSKASSVEGAQSASAEKINAIIAYLESEDIAEEDIKTEYYNAYPTYEWRQARIECVTFPCPQPPGEQVLTGYEVNQTVSVKVRDVESAGRLVSGVGEQGATNISGISFTVDDSESVKDEARALAIQDAREKARTLADELGVKLVRIIGFYEDQGYPVYADGYGGGFERAVSESAAPPQIPVGENQTVVNVTITFEIRD